MTIRTSRPTIGTTAQQITGVDDTVFGQRLCLRPMGGDIYVGGPDVSTTNGLLVKDGEIFEDAGPDAIYAVATANVTVHVFNGGVQ